jgi:ribosome-associated protein
MSVSVPAAPGPEEGTAIVVNERVSVPRHEVELKASRSGGPGGQHVNTSSTRIELTWNLERTTALSEDEKARVKAKLAARLDAEGTLRVVASEMRSQGQNRTRAEERFAELLRRALLVPKARKKTRPCRGAVEERLREKKRKSERKKDRRGGWD